MVGKAGGAPGSGPCQMCTTDGQRGREGGGAGRALGEPRKCGTQLGGPGPGCTHLPRLREVWAPDVPAGGRAGEDRAVSMLMLPPWGPGQEQSPSQAPGLPMEHGPVRTGRAAGRKAPGGPSGTLGLPAVSPALCCLFGPAVAGVHAAREGLRPAALAGAPRGNGIWQRARRALRSWHWHRCNSVTAGRQALCLRSAHPHTAPAAGFQAGRLAPGAAGGPEKPLCATRKGLFSKQDR